MAKHSPQFNDGRIMNGDYEGLYVLPMAIAMRDSAWDYASFLLTFAVDEFTDINPDSMYVQDEDLPQLAVMFDITSDHDLAEFMRDFPRDWDT